jgi:predicted aspartyl protease
MTKWRFKTIEGKIIERDIGEAIIECLGEKATRIVVFARKDDAEVLGVDALEGLRLEVDPITKQLRKIEALLAL